MKRDRAALLKWAESVRNPFRVLMSMTFDRDGLVRWRAIEATGWIVAAFAPSELDRVRDMLRRLLWQMNDESGGLAWHAPELIGEILVNVPALIPEYAGLLTAYFHEEPFERGAFYAVSRVAAIEPKLFHDIAKDLEAALSNTDPQIRCSAALALAKIAGPSGRDTAARLLQDHASLTQYDFRTGQLRDLTVSRAASEILTGLKQSPRDSVDVETRADKPQRGQISPTPPY
ncbi:MAG: hypothetical protein JSU65_13525 [Candidatus Zixiibacteriota bacterium]|nr:MAG: hypothetical protein JSU65_13525 [candidate division Zixibacteria bacterium]